MKYIEELNPGSCFLHKDIPFVLTLDFKKSGQKNAINLINGSNNWLDGSTIIEEIKIYTIDKNNNIIAINPDNNHDNSKNI